MSSLGSRYRSPSQSRRERLADACRPGRRRISACAMCGRPTVPPPAHGQDLRPGHVDAVGPQQRRRSARPASSRAAAHPGQLGDQLRVVRVEQVRQQVQRRSPARAPYQRQDSSAPRTRRSPAGSAPPRRRPAGGGVVVGDRHARPARRRRPRATSSAGVERAVAGRRVGVQVDPRGGAGTRGHRPTLPRKRRARLTWVARTVRGACTRIGRSPAGTPGTAAGLAGSPGPHLADVDPDQLAGAVEVGGVRSRRSTRSPRSSAARPARRSQPARAGAGRPAADRSASPILPFTSSHRPSGETPPTPSRLRSGPQPVRTGSR